ncbi:hypothetical protein F5148DRAFT_1302936 [Russula earlei]|uniref:Uncharacterized protein n=1 Tax=Russula earlei TaxID=71964 RepID=A0ACC0ULC9_9AGAM|nr:hypothetical protein F5148DRAFT_1302936 [Russula earlei]
MDYNTAASPFWDFSQSPSATFPQLAENDLFALLQKQFNPEAQTPSPFPIPRDGVDPSKISNLPAPAPVPPSPLSDDSSPSPPSTTDHLTSSRRQSTNSTTEQDAHELKRKASIDDLEDDNPSQKTSKKAPSRRKSGPSQDESRLLKRKEQNRAAQRAFRERKEKHVKDLEDKVAELEAKSMSAETENQHLKELLKRLQDENVSLRHTSFTFSVPRNADLADGSFNGCLFPPPTPSSSGAAPQSSSLDAPSAFPGDIDFGALTSFDPSSLNLLDDSDATMSFDFGGHGQYVPSKTPYKTIASAPMFMSFPDPISLESASYLEEYGSDTRFEQCQSWTGQTLPREGNRPTGSLDELFGGHIFGAQSPLNFNALMNSAATSPLSPPASTISIVHQSIPSTSGPSSSAGPSFESSDASSPAASSSSSGDCPKTRAAMEQRIQAEGSSVFAPSPPQETEPQTQVFRTPGGADGPMIMCKGATFPMTEASDKNIEVLAAWKTSNVDMNELCSEFTDKARCDGTKVVLDPQGVSSILEKLTARLQSSP